jgi:hypothetical protein
MCRIELLPVPNHRGRQPCSRCVAVLTFGRIGCLPDLIQQPNRQVYVGRSEVHFGMLMNNCVGSTVGKKARPSPRSITAIGAKYACRLMHVGNDSAMLQCTNANDAHELSCAHPNVHLRFKQSLAHSREPDPATFLFDPTTPDPSSLRTHIYQQTARKQRHRRGLSSVH